MCSAQDHDTGGRERSEWRVVVASFVLCSRACTKCFVLLTRSTGLHFLLPTCIFFCSIHCCTVCQLRFRKALDLLTNRRAERINTMLHLTNDLSVSLAPVEEGAERNEQT